jgi:uncharacterized oxidoreductase
LKGFGATEEEADAVARIMVEANLRGHDSHGVIQLTRYVKEVKEGVIKPGGRVRIVRETPCTALVDGGNSFGHYVGEKAMEIALDKAEKSGVGVVGVYNCAHVGMLAHYSMMALERDMVGVIMCNTPQHPQVAPWGGRAKFLGTNPISIAVPTQMEMPLVLDMATSVVAAGKVALAQVRGEKLPDDWVMDSEGRPSRDPEDYFQGGSLRPMDTYKGWGLALMIEALAGAMTGAGCIFDATQGYQGVLAMALRIDHFTPLEDFKTRIDVLIRRARDIPKAPGFKEIILPGEKEFREMEKRGKKGIPVDEPVWKDILALAEELNLSLPS